MFVRVHLFHLLQQLIRRLDNVASGGFITGCIIARNSGMKAGILSGMGFGAFGAAIDKLVSTSYLSDCLSVH